MIEELKDYKRPWSDTMHYLYEQPLLEYIWELAQSTFAPEDDLSNYPCLFANRYFERNLSIEERYERDKELNYTSYSFEKYFELKSNHRQFKDSFKDRFLSNEDLQNTIEAFGLDVSKFWYLLLFIYDYTEKDSKLKWTPIKKNSNAEFWYNVVTDEKLQKALIKVQQEKNKKVLNEISTDNHI